MNFAKAMRLRAIARKRRADREGLTLAELAVVIVVIGLIMGMVAFMLSESTALDDAARLDVQNRARMLSIKMRSHQMQHGPLEEGSPITAMGVNERNANDPWGNMYFICLDENRSRQICSYGSDGSPGGDGEAADFYLTREDSWPPWLSGELPDEEF